jgi:hypothetical protein
MGAMLTYPRTRTPIVPGTNHKKQTEVAHHPAFGRVHSTRHLEWPARLTVTWRGRRGVEGK